MAIEENFKADTYSVIEFQGYVSDSPSYDREEMRLDFKAQATNRPNLKFFAKGELAKAFKSILHQGCLIQASAVPIAHLEEWRGEKASVVEWECKRLILLGTKKVNLGNYADTRILDGLMPIEGEVMDVGYVEPITFGRFLQKREDARKEIKRREKIDDG